MQTYIHTYIHTHTSCNASVGPAQAHPNYYHTYLASGRCKAPTNSRVFDYSFVNFYSTRKTETKYSEAEHPADSRSRQPARSMWWSLCHAGSKPPVAPVTWCKVLETLVKFGELLDSLTARVEGSDSGLTMV